jgi:hypothetical protein
MCFLGGKNQYLTLQRLVLLYVPPGLALTIRRYSHTVHLRILCASQNKQRQGVCCAVRNEF